jgi:hypothetical protein
MSTMDLPTIQDELYGLPLSEFTDARDARSSEARRSGERELAASVKQLRKPSAAAWLGNMLVREREAEVERLIGLGETLRSSRTLDGDQIRAATKQKLDAVRKLLRHAQAIAEREKQSVSPAVLLDLEVTLDAAFFDQESAASLRSGHLIGPLHYSGLGFGSERASRTPSTAKQSTDGAASAATRATAKARKVLEQATRDAAHAAVEADKAEQAVVVAEADLKRLRAALAVADRKATKARQTESAARRKVEALKGPAER